MATATGSAEPIPRFAERPVTAIAAVAGAILLAMSARYGYHRDELYFLQAARHLAWGYDDQPPLTPLLMRAETAVFGDSVTAVRILPMLFSIGLVYLSALCARELGGSRAAQTLAAASVACGPITLFLGHIFVTANPDYFVWSLILWLVLRWVRTRNDRLWIAIGLVAGAGLLNNNLVAGLALVLIAGAVIAGPRDILRNRWVWFGAVIAVGMWTPYLVWQAQHAWPELKMMQHISSQQDQRAGLIPFQVEGAGLTAPIWFAGWWRLARNPTAARYRMFAWAYVLLLALLLVTGGHQYYPEGFFPLLYGGGAVAVVDWWRRAADPRARQVTVVLAIALTSAVTIVAVAPVLPARTYSEAGLLALNKENGETVGWPQLVDQVASAYADIPADQRGHAVVLAENYGVAGAIAHFGPTRGIPAVYSPHDGYNRFGQPSSDATGPVVVAGYQSRDAPPFLSGCVRHGSVDNNLDVTNQEQGWPIWLCSGPHADWSTLWPTLIHYS